MSLEVREIEKKPEYPRVGEGTYMARVVGVVDVGKHVRKNWKSQEVETDKHGNEIVDQLIFVNFELPTETIEIEGEDKPRWLSKEYKVSFFEKSALTALINAVSNGDQLKTLDNMIARPLMLTVGSTSGGKDKVTGVAPMMKGMEVPGLANPAQVFDIDDPDMEVWSRLPNFIKEKIQSSVNFADSRLAEKLAEVDPDGTADDIPF